jgi:CBS domain-containing protein
MLTGKDIPFVNENHGIKLALKKISKKKLGLLIIKNTKGLTKGIIVDGDIKRAMQKNTNIENLKIKDIMTKDPISIEKDTLAAKALDIMSVKKITSLCVYNRKNKQKTIIFCNTQVNCKSLFGQMKHIINKNNLNIKPHIYIGKNKNSNIDDINLIEKETDKNILDSFEKDDEISLIITCKKISMGYDYPKIDFVVFADPKCEKIEIAQCIGRGLRITDDPDKVCHVLLPVNEEEAEDSKFKTIISYFKYMRNECGYEILNSDCWYNRPDSENSDSDPKEGNNYGFDFVMSSGRR